jgi:hypothetical protein
MTNGTQRASADAPLSSADADERMRQMVADPQAYFTRARAEAKVEARRYVAQRLGRVKTA